MAIFPLTCSDVYPSTLICLCCSVLEILAPVSWGTTHGCFYLWRARRLPCCYWAAPCLSFLVPSWCPVASDIHHLLFKRRTPGLSAADSSCRKVTKTSRCDVFIWYTDEEASSVSIVTRAGLMPEAWKMCSPPIIPHIQCQRSVDEDVVFPVSVLCSGPRSGQTWGPLSAFWDVFIYDISAWGRGRTFPSSRKWGFFPQTKWQNWFHKLELEKQNSANHVTYLLQSTDSCSSILSRFSPDCPDLSILLLVWCIVP